MTNNESDGLSCVPSKEEVIAMVRRLGVKAVYPKRAGQSADEVVASIEATPDAKWYPPDDVFWTRKGGAQ